MVNQINISSNHMDAIPVLERVLIKLKLSEGFLSSSSELHRNYAIECQKEMLEDLIEILKEKLK